APPGSLSGVQMIKWRNPGSRPAGGAPPQVAALRRGRAGAAARRAPRDPRRRSPPFAAGVAGKSQPVARRGRAAPGRRPSPRESRSRGATARRAPASPPLLPQSMPLPRRSGEGRRHAEFTTAAGRPGLL
uniref:Uncharacterized protein n=5 Tax=Aegilops tauschii subsp. strangulata TaxID=200361 RepID=A0A453K1C1_AEGTS